MKAKLKIILFTILALFIPLSLSAEKAPVKNEKVLARMKDIQSADFKDMIDQTVNVYTSFTQGESGEVPESILKNSRCIAIIPKVITGALGVGISHGEGLASCKFIEGGKSVSDSKVASESWSQPVAISMNQASIGVQAGGKTTDLLLFFQTPKAATALKKGDFTLGSDVSVVAGKFDSNIDTTSAGIVAYSRVKGVFAGVSLNGGKIGKNVKNLQEYYGESFDYLAILEGRESPDATSYSKRLVSLFP